MGNVMTPVGIEKNVLGVRALVMEFDIIDAVRSEYGVMNEMLKVMQHFKEMCLLV